MPLGYETFEPKARTHADALKYDASSVMETIMHLAKIRQESEKSSAVISFLRPRRYESIKIIYDAEGVPPDAKVVAWTEGDSGSSSLYTAIALAGVANNHLHDRRSLRATSITFMGLAMNKVDESSLSEFDQEYLAQSVHDTIMAIYEDEKAHATMFNTASTSAS